MSSSWTQPQGHVGDLHAKKKEELVDILRRQERLLSNRRFIQSLPDKGQKIRDFVQKVQSALADHEETERKEAMLLSVKREFQSKYPGSLEERGQGNPREPSDRDWNILEQPHKVMSAGNADITNATSQNKLSDSKSELITNPDQPSNVTGAQADNPASVKMETASSPGEAAVLTGSAASKEEELVEVFERVTLDNSTSESSDASRGRLSLGDGGLTGRPIGTKGFQRRPHYMEVLEKTARDPAVRKPKFKPHQLPGTGCGASSGSSSPGQSPGAVTQLSPAERKLRDRKHLDDITAANLPPLHHTPMQLLSLEESTALQDEQKRKYEELQAKLAAQKLYEKMNIRMSSFNPEGGALARYREIHDDGAYHSEDD
ncbi:GRL1A polymerase, partial [Amia calva]|nr:GRL1A polymerase [Amia calva]